MITFFERLDKFMKFKGLNDNQITVEVGISNGLIGKGRKRGTLSQDNISKILQKYPELNAHWWFTGKGNMILTPDDYKISKGQHQTAEENVAYNKFAVIKELFGNDEKLDTIIEMLGSRFENIEDRLDKISILYKIEKEIEDAEKED